MKYPIIQDHGYLDSKGNWHSEMVLVGCTEIKSEGAPVFVRFNELVKRYVDCMIDKNRGLSEMEYDKLSKCEKMPLMVGEYKKPPLGLKPKHIHDEQRQVEIKQAINRYVEVGKEIPLEWIDEYNSYIK